MQSEDGVLLLGDEADLVQFERHTGIETRRLATQTMAFAGKALSAAGELQANSGRWVKLTKESAELVKKHGPALSKADKLVTGVVRGKGGQILKHLKFEHAALLTPAAPMMLASMLTQASLDAALDDIQEYLAVIDAKLDRLLKQRKVETLGQMGGVALAIEEARSIYESTGLVSSVTWSKVQTNSLVLQTMQAESLAQLNALAELVNERATDTDKKAAVLGEVREDVVFWLGTLARTMAMQDQQYVLELARVAEAEPGQLEQHREGITIARRSRTRRIAISLEAINASVRAKSGLTNRDRVANPFSSVRVADHANSVNDSIAEFARRADLALADVDHLARQSWGDSARALLGETAEQVGSAGNEMTARAKALGADVQERGDDAILKLARKVQERREGRRHAPEAIEGSDGEPANG